MAGPSPQLSVSGDESAREAPIRILIVDDSAVARAVLARMISQHDCFRIVDAVASAADALARLAMADSAVDVILLDIEMPGRSGISALPDLIARSGGARVLVVSALADEGAAATVEALTLGAADTLPKPGVGSFGGQFSDVLRDRLLRLGRAETVRPAERPALAVRLTYPLAPIRAEDHRLDCIAIGGSTGGPHAITGLLRALPQALDAPILVTQHLPASFMPIFAGQIESLSGRKTVVAREGMTIARGRVHVAPGHAHLCLERIGEDVIVRLRQHAVPSGCLPSVDPMFTAAAKAYGAGVAGVVMSGIGRDGTAGARDLINAGADIWAQDAESSVVWGMPGSVAKAGLAVAVLPPDGIARRLQRRWERA